MAFFSTVTPRHAAKPRDNVGHYCSRPDALPVTQPTAPKHGKQSCWDLGDMQYDMVIAG